MLPDFLEHDALERLVSEMRERWEQGAFQAAGVGRGAGHTVRTDVRGDQVLWLDSQNPGVTLSAYVQGMEALREELNRELYLSLVDFEAHFAVYPPGTFYRRHLDRFQDSDRRMLSTVLYLNPDWQESDGGQLRLYHPDETWTDIAPRLGTFVLFRSDTVPHEVLPANTQRYSITAWFRRRSLLPF